MAEKLLKTKKRAIKGGTRTPARASLRDSPSARGIPCASATEDKSFIVVGNYKTRQLEWIKKNGVYNWPVREGDEFSPEQFARINELWLYANAKSERHVFSAEFVGKMTAAEFRAAYPTYAKLGASKQKAYYVFKAKPVDYPPELGSQVVLARTTDFGRRCAKVKKAVEQFKRDGEFAPLAAYLPKELGNVPRPQLRVCEAAVQLEFLEEIQNNSPKEPVVRWGCRPVAIDLFAGCGGLSLGFEQAGFDIAAAVEIDPIHAAVHEYNFPYSKTICADIKNVSGDQIRNLSGLENRDVDVIFGGAPCQGFSMIGKRALDDPRNQLIKHYLRIVNDIRPKFCVLENVKGLTVGKHVKFLRELICELQKIQYKVLLPYRVLNAADYGVPQNRERLFLIAAREDQTLPVYPDAMSKKTTIRDAIEDLPDADHFDSLLTDDSANVTWQTRSDYGRRLRGLVEDDNDFGYRRISREGCLTASRRTIHTEETQRRFLAAPQGETEPHSRFFKLSWEGQSNTLRAGTDSARGGFTSPRPIHPVLPRVITVREGARVHSYPDWFRFNKTKWHGFREIGNSVPPLLARAVGSEIITALGVRPEKPVFPIRLGSEALLEFDMGKAAKHFSVSRNVIAQRKRKDNGK